jgi:predicted RNase H-like HicB family nuclease
MPAVNQDDVTKMVIIRIDEDSNYEVFTKTPKSVVQRIESAKEAIQELSDKWADLAGDTDARIEYNFKDANGKATYPTTNPNQIPAAQVTLPDVTAIVTALDSALTTAQALEVTFPD